MTEIVNLRLARKRKRRTDREKESAANRLAHGRTGSEQTKSRLLQIVEEKRLAGHRREEPEGGGRN